MLTLTQAQVCPGPNGETVEMLYNTAAKTVLRIQVVTAGRLCPGPLKGNNVDALGLPSEISGLINSLGLKATKAQVASLAG
jgi:hypothetical protein